MTAMLAQIYLLKHGHGLSPTLVKFRKSGNSELDIIGWNVLVGQPVCKVESFPLTQTCNKFLKDCRLCNLFCQSGMLL